MSPFAPWTQQVTGARAKEEPAVDYAEKEYGWPWEKRWWEEPWRNLYETTPEGTRGAAIPSGWGRAIGAGVLGGAAALAAPAAAAAIPAWMGRHKLLSMLGLGVGSYAAWANRPGQGQAFPTTGVPEFPPYEPAPATPPTGLPQPEDYPPYTGEPFGQPQVIEVGGQRFWWNPMGQGGIGGWELLTGAAATGAGGLTPEQQLAQYQAQREAELEQIRLRYELEREMQGAGAAQTMAQMYAADPYKYWAQLGMGTPGAMARLTRGEIEPGEEFRHTPLSQPSAQWWGNLLPSEQQQIMGGINWMGVDPQDWYSIYQRMIPGLGARQMEPVWAR